MSVVINSIGSRKSGIVYTSDFLTKKNGIDVRCKIHKLAQFTDTC